MSFNDLPPEAYTRDVLIAAYNWVQSQPAAIREMATSQDTLVSLFLQDKRNPNNLKKYSNTPRSSEISPVPDKQTTMSLSNTYNSPSAEAFKNDLMNLAEGLKQFEEQTSESNTLKIKTEAVKPAPNYLPPSLPVQSAPLTTPAPAIRTKISDVKTRDTSDPMDLDPRSEAILIEVQKRLNLSQKSEALRLIITLGYDKIKDWLPKL